MGVRPKAQNKLWGANYQSSGDRLLEEGSGSASNTTRPFLGNSGAYLALSGRNIGQSWSILSRKIILLRLIELQPSNQGVGGSNPSGRAPLIHFESASYCYFAGDHRAPGDWPRS